MRKIKIVPEVKEEVKSMKKKAVRGHMTLEESLFDPDFDAAESIKEFARLYPGVWEKMKDE